MKTLSALALTLAALAVAPAFAGERVAKECADPAILHRIQSKFDHQVRNVPHLPDVSIARFGKVHQHRYLPAKEKWPVARRYCGATATLSDGRKRYVWYLIENPWGYAGVGNNVEFCVSGFDRWYVYSGRCRVLR